MSIPNYWFDDIWFGCIAYENRYMNLNKKRLLTFPKHRSSWFRVLGGIYIRIPYRGDTDGI